jgi:hypothetical protein
MAIWCNFTNHLPFEVKMQLQLEVTNQINIEENAEYIPWENLHLEFHRAIKKRLNRRGEVHLMDHISRIREINHLDQILEALLEGQSKAAIYSLI